MKISKMSKHRKTELSITLVRYFSAMLLIHYTWVGKPTLGLFTLIGLNQIIATYQMDRAIDLRKEPKKKVKHVRKKNNDNNKQ